MRGKAAPLPERGEVAAALSYDPETGSLTWRTGIFAGKLAGGIGQDGYARVRLNRKLYLSHRLIWKLIHNGEPSEIDHIDNDRGNNKIENLRAANSQKNGFNRLKTASNRSGYKGVSWYKKLSKWKASICINYKTIHIGYFVTAEEAHNAYLIWARELQGEFHNTGER